MGNDDINDLFELIDLDDDRIEMTNFSSSKENSQTHNQYGSSHFEYRHHHRHHRRSAKKLVLRIFLIVAIVLVVIVAATGIVYVAMNNSGRLNLKNNAISANVIMISDDSELTKANDSVIWKEGWVKYKGEVYQYNDDLLTFLVMGIDSKTEVDKTANGAKAGQGGQSDALLLVVMNLDDRTIRLVNINRNVMTDIDVYDLVDTYIDTIKAQLALQHGYGDGMKTSCERTVNAVSNLFYGIPIHGYASVNYVIIPEINDIAGGVTVTLLDDFTFFDKSMVNGTTMTLTGRQAFKYVQYRDTKSFASVNVRMERIKQYLSALIVCMKDKTLEDITFVTKVYDTIQPYMVTNITLDEIVYLASTALTYDIELDNFYSLEGETKMGSIYEEFYADEDYLHDLVISLFYEPVDLK